MAEDAVHTPLTQYPTAEHPHTCPNNEQFKDRSNDPLWLCTFVCRILCFANVCQCLCLPLHLPSKFTFFGPMWLWLPIQADLLTPRLFVPLDSPKNSALCTSFLPGARTHLQAYAFPCLAFFYDLVSFSL